MNVELFKTDLRKVIDNNQRPIKFTIRFSDSLEIESFETKKDFGLRVLELLEDETVGTIEIETLKRIDHFGRHDVARQDFVRFTDIEAVVFNVIKENDINKDSVRKQKEEGKLYYNYL